ncbi:MAG TPA: SMI1/KNR4 family protein [Verrucomicrobiae bacterium]|jgi:hypothetical protein|nr:SMI1/KNR4 family protein [Verrucomicrobiae bacterium]
MSLYNQIETRYGFKIPEEYRRLEEKGWLNWNDKSTDYLWIDDGEWLTPEQILDYKFKSYHKPGFVPFARTGSGDAWCWYPEWSVNGIAPVVFCPHDCYDGNCYAPSFLGWIFRTIVEFASSGRCADEASAREYFAQWQKMVVPMMPPAWAAIISGFEKKQFRTWPEEQGFGGSGFISMKEADEIVKQHLEFPHLNEELQWMTPVRKWNLSHLDKK